VRVIVLLLAVVMMTGATAQVACASPDVMTAVDDAPDLGTPIVPDPAVIPVPERRMPVRIEALPPAHGRMHALLVFRPPRLIASR
jgi:hypothetical protein